MSLCLSPLRKVLQWLEAVASAFRAIHSASALLTTVSLSYYFTDNLSWGSNHCPIPHLAQKYM